jgi:cobyrinic acid a,c-diamide synthase
MFWSPLQDAELPAGTQGLYFGGGFPEMFAQQLADNRAARAAVRAAIQSGMPTYAECGGLMYLCQQMIDFEECTYPMVGILPTAAIMGKRLTLGYRRAIAQHNTPLLVRGQTVWGHEFHRSYLTVAPENPLFEIKKPEGKQADLRVFGKLRGLESPILPSLHLPIFPIPHPPSPIPHPLNEGWYLYQLHASYIHLHWGACPEIPLRFLEHCQQFQLPSCKIPDF